jgi:hypothetical protein
MSSKRFLRMTATIFAVVALAHLVRLALVLPVTVGGWGIPMWVSLAAAIAAGLLSFIGFRLAKRARDRLV